MNESLPPRAVCIASALSIAFGVGAIAHMISGVFVGRFVVNFLFVGIPIGYGILLGRRSSRKWALVFSGAGAILLPVAMALTIYGHVTAEDGPTALDLAFNLIIAMTTLAGCVYTMIALRGAPAREWFNGPAHETSSAGRFAWSVGVVACLFLVYWCADDWRMDRLLDSVYPIDVRVTPCDAETGKGVASIGVEGTSGSRAPLPKIKINLMTSGSSEAEGTWARYRGIAASPVKVRLTSPGYEDATITLTRDSPKEIRLALQRAVAPVAK
jgi:hypothetical protein